MYLNIAIAHYPRYQLHDQSLVAFCFPVQSLVAFCFPVESVSCCLLFSCSISCCLLFSCSIIRWRIIYALRETTIRGKTFKSCSYHRIVCLTNMFIYSNWFVEELLHFKTCFDCLVVTLKLQMFEYIYRECVDV